jgi:hypothetical protein
MKHGGLLPVAIFFALSPPVMSSDRAPRVGRHPAVTPQSAYGRLPLYFEPNVGQFDPRVRYVTRGSGYTLFLTDSETAMVFSGGGREKQAAVRMKLVGARSPARWEALEKQPAIGNYFLGNDPKKWHTDVPTYARVSAHGVYPGVDLGHLWQSEPVGV